MSSAQNIIKAAIHSNVPLIWRGPPGVGKTAVLQAIASSLNMAFVSVSAAYLDPADISGLPVPESRAKASGAGEAAPTATQPAPNMHLVRLHDEWAAPLFAPAPCLFLIDEVNRGSTPVFNALLRVVQERIMGNQPLGQGVRIVMTANPVSTDSGAREIPTAFSNRCLFTDAEVPVKDWHNWMLGQTAAHSMIVGFLTHKPDYTYRLPEKGSPNPNTFPSRRSWDNVARILAPMMAGRSLYKAASDAATGEVMMECVAGLVGRGPATELLAWARLQDLPAPEELLSGAKPLPTRGDMKISCVGSVIGWLRQDPSNERATQVAVWLCDQFDLGHKDVATVGAELLSQSVAPTARDKTKYTQPWNPLTVGPNSRWRKTFEEMKYGERSKY